MRDQRAAGISASASDADNDSADRFARTVARAFSYCATATPKRRPGEVSVLNLKLNGYASQLFSDDYGFALVLYRFRHKDQRFRRAHDAYVMFRATKPERRHGTSAEIKAAEKKLGLRAFTVIGPKMIDDGSVRAFCLRHRERIEALKLRGSEDIGITHDSIRFRWLGDDLPALYPRFLAFAKLVDEMSRPPEREPQLFTREWILKPVAKSKQMNSEAVHSFGGRLAKRIKCPHCGAATNLMAQIDLSDRRLPKSPLGRDLIPVFWCLNCQEGDATFFDISKPTPRPLDDRGAKLKLQRIDEGEDDLPERCVTLRPVPRGKKAGRRSKVGGTPTWIQLDDGVDCPKCEKPMPFVLQLASGSYFEFHDSGILYVFACPECKVTASFVQSY